MAPVLALGMLATSVLAVAPDLINGGVPTDTLYSNLGATGLHGWVYHEGSSSSASRQILVTSVDALSPADGTIAVGDVILGASGTVAAPVNFTDDARKSLSYAITDAEALDPGILKLIRWRDGVPTITVEITLQTLGAYTATAPYNCPKSALILEQGLQYVMANEDAGLFSLGTLALLAGNDPENGNNTLRQTRAQTEAYALIPSAAEIASMTSGEIETTGKVTWNRGHQLIVLAEYYLATSDATVLPALDAYVQSIGNGLSMFGSAGHQFTPKTAGGDLNGPYHYGYGVVNSAAMPCFLGLVLAKECGLTTPQLDPSIERASRYYAYYAGRGGFPYGEHAASTGSHSGNGKSGIGALAFALQNNRVEEKKFFAQMCTSSVTERGGGHTGPYFNFLWSPLGANTGGEEAAASYFSRSSWMLDLARRWDGGFDYDTTRGANPGGNDWYGGYMSTVALLNYAMPLRQLHITGKGQNFTNDLTSAEVSAAAFSDDYDKSSRTTNELIADLGDWSPKVQYWAAEELGIRTLADPSLLTTLLPTLVTLANDTNGTSRIGACRAMGEIDDPSSGPILSALLTDSENHVRFVAAEALRYLPQSVRLAEVNTILAAAASTAKPLLPLDEEDPLQFAHGRLAMLLFSGGGSSGQTGVIYNDLTGVDRNLLYPAIEALAATPSGINRGGIKSAYSKLTEADVLALADTIVESVHVRAPADYMFSSTIQHGGITVLQKYDIAEGVPLAIHFIDGDPRGGVTNALAALEAYAGSFNTFFPYTDVIAFCEDLVFRNIEAVAAQAVLDAIAADSANPATLTPFKSIQSAVTDAVTLTLPMNQTQLHVNATDLANGDTVYTWRKVYGAGNVTFTPNGTGASKDTTIVFDNVPGQYLFEVKMSDSRGLTEVSDTVAVTLFDTDGTLPSNDPPTADPQSLVAATMVRTPITLTGSDPEALPLVYTVTSLPQHGSLSGSVPNLVYLSESTYSSGVDSFDFMVTDSEGQTATATVTINVDVSSGIELFVYEPFDYPTGPLAGQSGGTGLSGAWANGSENGTASVYDETTAITPVDTDGSRYLSWNGVVDNLPTSPSSGARYVGLTPYSGGYWSCYRPLVQDAGTMAGDDGILWVSMAWHAEGGSWGQHIGLALSTDSYNDRGRQIDTSGSYGSGAGNAIGLLHDPWNDKKASPAIFDGGLPVASTEYPSGSNGGDHVLVLKFEFGATDTVSSYVFKESTTLKEALFENNMVSATGTIDESTLNMLTFSNVQGEPAFDEIRIGNTFAAVVGVAQLAPDMTSPTPDPLSFAILPTTLDAQSITMTAVTASDANGVEYYFTCVSGGGADSGWQSSPVYTAGGLQSATEYTYTVMARDRSTNGNTTEPSVAASATTSINQAPVVNAGADQNNFMSEIAWTPAGITTALWLDASDSDTITASAGAVSQWSDKSGNSNDFVQSSSTKQPATGVQSIGGLNALSFDNGDYLDTSSLGLSTSAMAIFVYNPNGDTGYSVFGDTAGAVNDSWDRWTNDSNTYAHNFRTSRLGPLTLSIPSSTGENMLAYMADSSNPDYKIRLNGNETYSNTAAFTFANNINRIGHSFDGAAYLNGFLGEVVIVDNFSLPDIQKLEGYLAHKWGLVANLPEGHPYKSATPGAPSATVNLNATATDADGNALTTVWSVADGPGSVTFGNTALVNTTATFSTTGTYTLRLTADDGFVQVSNDIVITVVSARYSTWSSNGTDTETATFANPSLFVGSDTTPSSNPDGDNMNNLLEFAFGTDPTVNDSGSLVADGSVNGLPIPLSSDGGITFDLLFVRRDDHATPGSLTYTPQFSSDLVTYYDSASIPVALLTPTPTLVADSTDDPDYEVVKVPFPTGDLPDGEKARFGRIDVTETP